MTDTEQRVAEAIGIILATLLLLLAFCAPALIIGDAIDTWNQTHRIMIYVNEGSNR